MKITQCIINTKNTLCVGIDSKQEAIESLIVVKTVGKVPAYKFNLAGWLNDIDYLKYTIKQIQDSGVQTYIILDAKFCDVTHTTGRFLDQIKDWGVDAVTTVPFMGFDHIDKISESGLEQFIVVNPSSMSFPSVSCLASARNFCGQSAISLLDKKGVSFVVANNEYFKTFSEILNGYTLLIPGIGIQEGKDIKTAVEDIKIKSPYTLYNVGRSLLPLNVIEISDVIKGFDINV